MADGKEEKVSEKVATLYRDNEIDGFRMGALFDLRVRFAFEMLQHGGASALVSSLEMKEASEAEAEAMGRLAARAALGATTELVRLAEERGLVTPLPEEMSTMMRRHVPRLMAFELEKHVVGTRMQQGVAGRIATPAGVPSPILPANETKQ